MGGLLYAAYFNLGQHFVAERSYYCDDMFISVKQKPTRKLPCTVEPAKLDHNSWKCTEGEGAKLLGFEEALEKVTYAICHGRHTTNVRSNCTVAL